MENRINLAREILRDLGRHKFQLILWLAILGTAMTIIVMTNETRLLTINLNQLLEDRDKLDIEWRHLVLEQNALAEHSRVSDIARDKLEMARPSPLKSARTGWVTVSDTTVARKPDTGGMMNPRLLALSSELFTPQATPPQNLVRGLENVRYEVCPESP